MSELVNETHGMDAATLAHRAKEASFALAALPGEVRSRALAAAAKALRAPASKEGRPRRSGKYATVSSSKR